MTTIELLAEENDHTIHSVIHDLNHHPAFQRLAKTETSKLVKRDREDEKRMKQNLEVAIEKGILQRMGTQPYMNISIQGKFADQVADEIIEDLSISKTKDSGYTVSFVGLPEKGTIISKIVEKIPKAYSFSIDNCFRALTLLAVQFCNRQRLDEFDVNVLTPDILKILMSMLRPVKYRGCWDIRISRLTNGYVSELEDNRLLDPDIHNNVSAVARLAHGEVVTFVTNACKMMENEGTVVLLEGREQMLDYIPTYHRYCLVMDKIENIGLQRAAQLVVGDVLSSLNKNVEDLLKTHLHSRSGVKEGEENDPYYL